MSDDLSQLKNVGPKTIGWLHEIGIYTVEDLRVIGAVEAYKRLKAAFPHKVTLNALYGLEGALSDRRWDEIPPEVKAQLKAEVANEKGE